MHVCTFIDCKRVTKSIQIIPLMGTKKQTNITNTDHLLLIDAKKYLISMNLNINANEHDTIPTSFGTMNSLYLVVETQNQTNIR